MKLLELAEYLASPSRLQALCQTLGFSDEALEDGEVVIYMENSLSLESEVRLFEAAETDDLLELQRDGMHYRYMLQANLAAELFEGAKGRTTLEKAERVLHYAIYDA